MVAWPEESTGALCVGPPSTLYRAAFGPLPPALSVTVTDNAGGSGPKAALYSVDGGPTQSAPVDSSGHATITVANGKHTLTFWGQDAATNEEATHHTLSVNVDTVH